MALGIVLFVLVWMRRDPPGRLGLISAGMLIGGALGNVVDRKTLTRIFFLVMGTLGTIGPIIIALRPRTDEAGADRCALSDAQKEAVRAVVASWENSSTCSYNQTLDDIIAGL